MPTEIGNTIEILSNLIAFPTIAGTSNLALIDYVEQWLVAHGATCNRVPSPDGTSSNLYATIGPMVEGGIVLSGHTDVVATAGQNWSSNPFVLTEREGKLFGRGTCDMKGFLACALALVPMMRSARLKRPIHFAFSYDEELGCLGAPSMIEEMRMRLPKTLAVIVGEPSTNRVVSGHKGCVDFTTTVYGHPIHSSLNYRGVNAISYAANLIAWLDNRQALSANGPHSSEQIEPPFTTFHCGLINGGTASNVVPEKCVFTTDIRTVPGDDGLEYLKAYREFIDTDLVPRMREISANCRIDVDIQADIPSLNIVLDSPAERFMRALTGDNAIRCKGGVTEAGQFQRAGFSTVICGPGSTEQAHLPDEFVAKSEVEKCTQVLSDLIQALERD